MEENASTGGTFEDDLGDAFDLWYGFNYSRNVSFIASYSQLSPGDFFTETSTGLGPEFATDDSPVRLYGQVRLRF